MTAVRVLIQSESQGQRQETMPVNGPISIGRHAQCVLRLDSDLVSRQHAVVQIGPQSILVEDVSTNGTLAGGGCCFGARRSRSPSVHRSSSGTSPSRSSRSRPRPLRPLRSRAGAAAALRGRPVLPVRRLLPWRPRCAPEVGSRRPSRRRCLRAHTVGSPRTPRSKRSSCPRARRTRRARKRSSSAATSTRRCSSTSTSRRSTRRSSTDRDALIGELSDEALGLGPLERFLADPKVSEIMVVDPNTIYVERRKAPAAEPTRASPTTSRARAVIERIVTPLGRRIDESSPSSTRASRTAPASTRSSSRSRSVAPASPSGSSRRCRSPSRSSRASARSPSRWGASSRAAWSPRRTSSSRAARAPARRRCSTCSRPHSQGRAHRHHRGRRRAPAPAAARRVARDPPRRTWRGRASTRSATS
jgi:hypothetical protein